jgi:hypothetical protein
MPVFGRGETSLRVNKKLRGRTVVILTKISETIQNQDQTGSYAHRLLNIPLIKLQFRFVAHNQIFMSFSHKSIFLATYEWAQ